MSSPYPCPSGNLSGWTQTFREDFDTDCSVGAFPGSAYGSQFSVYQDGWKDTAGQAGATSRYWPSKVVSVAESELLLTLHTETISGVSRPLSAAVLPLPAGGRDFLYGRTSICFKAEALAGFKTAWLLWPQSGNKYPDGEIDWPEGDLDNEMSAFMHWKGATQNSQQDAYPTSTPYTDWHIATLEWLDTRCTFLLDDGLIGESTDRIPNTPMHWVIQTERSLSVNPDPATTGVLHIDWAVMYTVTDSPPVTQTGKRVRIRPS